MKRTIVLPAAAAVAVLCGALGFAARASAQVPPYVPPYTTWQQSWNANHYDRHHVILGVVSAFSPYRLTVQRHGGAVQTIDLKHGTRIFPVGATPQQGQMAAVLGYYSNGTFIADRVVLRH